MTVNLESIRPIVDQPDFDEALRNDSDGSFKVAVESYLSEWKALVAADLSRGLPPVEYEALTLFSESLETASKVTEFLILAETLFQRGPGSIGK